MRIQKRTFRKLVLAAIGCSALTLACSKAQAFESLGIGTGALIGNDLTDLGDDGDPEQNINYDAIFDASHEPGFGAINADPASAGAGESAFNVFDNRVGGGNDKWCCGVPGGITEDDPMWITARLPVRHFLTNFTIASANDTPERDPIHWAIQGSNDGVNFSDIYVYQDDIAPWVDRLEVIEWRETEDFPVQATSYEWFRFATYDTIHNQNANAAFFQVAEIELFGRADGVVPPLYVGGQGTIGVQGFEGDQSNEMFGPEVSGVPGWTARIVTFEEHGLTLDNHTIAEDALIDQPGTVGIGAYPVVDMGGGAGTFAETQPYPNGVNNDSQSDFAVQVLADVVIPVGTWTIGFGSDDGGQLTIPGVEFDASLNDDMFEVDQVRFEGNRGHGWTVGVFEVTGEPLETSIIASMHERGGGDSFEIAVIEGDVLEGASPATGWELLADGSFGWSVTTTAAPLVSADLSAGVSATRTWQFDVNGDTGASDQMAVDNPDPTVFNTILNVDGVTFEIAATGAVSSGESFKIIDASQIVGTPTITSAIAGQNWVFDAATGQVCLDACSGGLRGDYNGNGVLDAGDADLQAIAMQTPNQNLATYDENGDGTIDISDRLLWANDLANTWVGDSNLDGEFNSGDLVFVFVPGKYETGDAAGWAEGDWNGDGIFSSADFVAAFANGGYEQGPRAAVAAVPEPSGIALLMTSLLGLFGIARRK